MDPEGGVTTNHQPTTNQTHYQMGRRNLADIDRIGLQVCKEELLKPIAEKSYRDNVGRPNKSSAILPTIKVDTRKECAKSAGVGERTYDAGKMILEEGGNNQPPTNNQPDPLPDGASQLGGH